MRGQRGEDSAATSFAASANARRGVPPGQRPSENWPVTHYGPVPRRKLEDWDIRVSGATASGDEHVLKLDVLDELPHRTVYADLHCVSGFSVLDLTWEGIPSSALLEVAPPRTDVSHVMVYAEYGYSANLTLADFAAATTLLATHVGGKPLPRERGGPIRLVVPHLYAWKGPKWLRAIEYLTEDRRGFWEERGYHNVADPWAEGRYTHQENHGDGPPIF